MVSQAPWLTSRTYKVRDRVCQLYNEIIDFYNFISLTQDEKTYLQTIFQSLAQYVRCLWHDAYCTIAGMFDAD